MDSRKTPTGQKKMTSSPANHQPCHKAAIIRLFAAFAALESFRLCYMRLCFRLCGQSGLSGSENVIFPLACLAVIAGMALAPLITAKRDPVKVTIFARFLALGAAAAMLAGSVSSGCAALIFQFVTISFASGAASVCLSSMTALLPPRRIGLAVGLSLSGAALCAAILFFPPFGEMQAGVIFIVMCGLSIAAALLYDAKRFEAAAAQIKLMPVLAGRLPSGASVRRFILILCLFSLGNGLFDNLRIFGAAINVIPNSEFIMLLFAALVHAAAGFAFERVSVAAAMLCGFALILSGQLLPFLSQTAPLVYPYALLSHAGNSVIEVYLISLPAAYCALSRRTGALSGLGYILLYGGALLTSLVLGLMPERFHD